MPTACMVMCSCTLACHPGPRISCGQSPMHEWCHDDIWCHRHSLHHLHQQPHHHKCTAFPITCPVHSCYAARLAAGKGQLWPPLQMSHWSRLFWGMHCWDTMMKPPPCGASLQLPSAMCLQHAQRRAPPLGMSPGPSGPTRWGHHIPIAIPTAVPTVRAIAVEVFRSSDGLCWHTYLHAKHVPTMRAVTVEVFRSSDGLCRSEAHPCAPGLEDDGEEPTSACPLLDASRAMPGHPTPLPLSNLLWHHATLVASPTSAVERHASAPPRPPGPT